MSDSDDIAKPTTTGNMELGVLICKICNEVVATLPTNGVKKIYGICGKKTCLETAKR